MIRKIWTALLFALLMLAAAAGMAEEAEDLTPWCAFGASSAKTKYNRMTDGNAETYWASKEGKHSWLEITTPVGKPAAAVYLAFRNRPDSYAVQVKTDGDWETVAEGTDGIYHAFHEIPGGAEKIRIYATGDRKQAIGFTEIRVFGAGEIPDSVQRWEPMPESADTLVIAGRWDGETGLQGALRQELAEGKTVALACLTYIGPAERAETLNRLWDEGLRIHPVFGGFKDVKKRTVDGEYKALGGKDKVSAWVGGVMKDTKAETVIFPDPEDEDAHILTRTAGDAARDVVKKTAGVREAYAVRTNGSSAQILSEEEIAAAAATPVPVPAAVPSGPWNPADHLDASVIAVLPELNERGYLDEGEFIHTDEENGLYIYITPTLRVIVRQMYDPNETDRKHPLVWFDAEIWCDAAAGELPQSFFFNPEKPNSKKSHVPEIAAQYNAVFACSTDYYIYRIQQPYPTGIEVRNGEIIFDDRFTDPAKVETRFPNYDTLAFFPDGHIECHPCYEWSAQDYIDHGAYDVFSFGPCLVRDGELTDRVVNGNSAYNPRMGFGMVEPGHYVILLCEGRVARSKGVQWQRFGQMFKDRGCTLAVNLDGGQTCVMSWLGKQMNQVDKNVARGREVNEILAFGISETAYGQ